MKRDTKARAIHLPRDDGFTVPEARIVDDDLAALASIYQRLTARPASPVEIGRCYFFRTVTYHLVGLVMETRGGFVRLTSASWVADSGRFMQAIKDGVLREVEPVGECWVNLDAVTDFFPWPHALPSEQQ